MNENQSMKTIVRICVNIKMAVRTVFNRRAQNLVHNTKYGKTDHVILALQYREPNGKIPNRYQGFNFANIFVAAWFCLQCFVVCYLTLSSGY